VVTGKGEEVGEEVGEAKKADEQAKKATGLLRGEQGFAHVVGEMVDPVGQR
jgi:hypothetical protein